MDCESEECPVTVITATSKALINLTSEAKTAFDGYGIRPANADDTRVHDALVTVQRCRNEESVARMEAQTRT